MATHFSAVSTTSDLSLGGLSTRKLIYDTDSGEGSHPLLVSLTASQVTSIYWATASGVPNSDAWTDPSSIQGFRLNANTTNMNITARGRFHRVNSSGTIQQSSSFSSSVTIDVTSVDLIVGNTVTWASEACSDRFVVEVEFTNTASMSSQSFNMGLKDAGTDRSNTDPDNTDFLIALNGGTCGGAVPRRIFLIS